MAKKDFNEVNREEIIFVDFEMTVGRDMNDVTCHKDIPAEESPDGIAKIGDRIWQASMMKARKDSDGKWVLTGEKYETMINPEIAIVPAADGFIPTFVNEAGEKVKYSDAEAKKHPTFKQVSDDILKFIGDREVVVTCWVIKPDGTPFEASLGNMKEPEGCHVRDIDFFNEELKRAGKAELPREQFNNVKNEFAVVMGGNRASSLGKVVSYCAEKYPDFEKKAGFTVEEFKDKNHDAIIDTKALAAVMPYMKEEFKAKEAEYKASLKSGVQTPKP